MTMDAGLERMRSFFVGHAPIPWRFGLFDRIFLAEEKLTGAEVLLVTPLLAMMSQDGFFEVFPASL